MLDADKPSLADLEHYGVKGMKWGLRRGGLGSRFKGALADRNQRTTAVATRMREGRSKGAEEKLAGAIGTAANLGRARRDKKLDKRLAQLADQRKRLESGKLKARDVLEIAGHVQLVDLVVSRRDNKG